MKLFIIETMPKNGILAQADNPLARNCGRQNTESKSMITMDTNTHHQRKQQRRNIIETTKKLQK